MMPYRLAIRMVPRSLWCVNLRKGRFIPKSRWEKIKGKAFDQRGLTCQTCGKVETERKRLNVHEEWEYLTDRQPALARLTGLKISCWHCHMLEHFGALENMVRTGELTQRAIDETVENFCRVNKVGRDQFNAHLANAKAEWMRLNRLKWEIDWDEYAAVVKETAQKREQRRQQREEESDEEDEDQALYQWPYLHSGKSW